MDGGMPGGSFRESFDRELVALEERLNCRGRCTWDVLFLCFLELVARFGIFTLGPITIAVRPVEELVERTVVRGDLPPNTADLVEFSRLLMQEVRRSGRKRIDELHYLLTFMRCGQGLPARVFGELGVSPEQIEAYLRGIGGAQAPLERLMTPEEVATFLQVHVQSVRAWIRSGTLPARRIAGLRALRVDRADVVALLRAVDDRPGNDAQPNILPADERGP